LSGDPGSGKSVVAGAIAQALGIVILAKDDLKEILFDTLGWDDREWSKKLGIASYELTRHTLELLLGSGASVVLDSNLHPQTWNMIRGLLARHPCHVIELVCFADPSVVMERFERRADSGERHPGHVDASNVAEFAARVACEPSGPTIDGSRHAVIDTSGDIEQTRAIAIGVCRRWLDGADTDEDGNISE
jgi:predicted kinase